MLLPDQLNIIWRASARQMMHRRGAARSHAQMELPSFRSVPCRLVGPCCYPRNCCLTAQEFGGGVALRTTRKGASCSRARRLRHALAYRFRNMDREIVADQQRQCWHQAAGRDGAAVGSSSAKAE